MTSFQHEAHFLRQLKGRWQLAQVFSGKNDFLCIALNMGRWQPILKFLRAPGMRLTQSLSGNSRLNDCGKQMPQSTPRQSPGGYCNTQA